MKSIVVTFWLSCLFSFSNIFGQNHTKIMSEAYLAYEEQLFEKTIETLNSIENTSDVSYFNLLGDAKLKLGKNALAIEAYNNSLTIDESNIDALLHRAIANIGIDNLNDAKKDLSKVLKNNPTHIKSQYYLAEIAYRYFKNNKALAILEEVLHENENYYDAIFLQSAILFDLENWQEAEHSLVQTFNLDTNNLEVKLHLGECRYALKDFEGTIKEMSYLIKRDQKTGVAYFYRGDAKRVLGNQFGACKDYLNSADNGDEEGAQAYKNYCAAAKYKSPKTIKAEF